MSVSSDQTSLLKDFWVNFKREEKKKRTFDEDTFTYGIPEVEQAKKEAEKRGLVTPPCTYLPVSTEKYKYRKSPALSFGLRHRQLTEDITPAFYNCHWGWRENYKFPTAPSFSFTGRHNGFVKKCTTPSPGPGAYLPADKFKYPSSPKPVLIGRHEDRNTSRRTVETPWQQLMESA